MPMKKAPPRKSGLVRKKFAAKPARPALVRRPASLWSAAANVSGAGLNCASGLRKVALRKSEFEALEYSA